MPINSRKVLKTITVQSHKLPYLCESIFWRFCVTIEAIFEPFIKILPVISTNVLFEKIYVNLIDVFLV